MLEATLRVSVETTGVELELVVENAGDEAVTLAFPEPRRATFVARRGGEERWRWSGGRIFDQSSDAETLASGDALTFEAAWANPEPGEYRIVGEVAAESVDLRAETTVTVPERG